MHDVVHLSTPPTCGRHSKCLLLGHSVSVDVVLRCVFILHVLLSRLGELIAFVPLVEHLHFCSKYKKFTSFQSFQNSLLYLQAAFRDHLLLFMNITHYTMKKVKHCCNKNIKKVKRKVSTRYKFSKWLLCLM